MRKELVATIVARNPREGQDEHTHARRLEMDIEMCSLTREEAKAVWAWVYEGKALEAEPLPVPDHSDELPEQEALAAHIAASEDGMAWRTEIGYTAANYPEVHATHRETGRVFYVRSAEEFAQRVERWAGL